MANDPTLGHLSRLTPPVRIRAYWLVVLARYAGLPLVVTASTRSAAEQRQLVAAGRSRTLDSKHLVGRAFDVDVYGWSRDDVPRAVWNWLGGVGEALGLRWGGRFAGFFDAGHFEL